MTHRSGEGAPRLHPVELPAVTYCEVGAWVVDNAFTVDDPSSWRTEIGWPVFPLTDSLAPR